MGTDIHGVFQRYNGATWEDIPHRFEMNRHYQLFAVLAGVRNGTGFAGVPTGQAVRPISEPRGYPLDFKADDDHYRATHEVMDPVRQQYYTPEEVEENGIWMGDHSHSWLGADEMLAWYETAADVLKVGLVNRATYDKWDGKSAPESYCDGIWGPDVVIVNDNAVEMGATPNWTHARVTWESDLKQELAYFFDEVRRLQDEHGQVRFVFGFDS